MIDWQCRVYLLVWWHCKKEQVFSYKMILFHIVLTVSYSFSLRYLSLSRISDKSLRNYGYITRFFHCRSDNTLTIRFACSSHIWDVRKGQRNWIEVQRKDFVSMERIFGKRSGNWVTANAHVQKRHFEQIVWQIYSASVSVPPQL